MRTSMFPNQTVNSDVLKMICEEEGTKIIDLSVGKLSEPSLVSARIVAAQKMMNVDTDNEIYCDLLSFAERLVAWHLGNQLPEETVEYLPIPGIDSILGMVPFACGPKLLTVAVPSPEHALTKNWCCCLKKKIIKLEINSTNGFLFDPKKIHGAGLVMMNYPHYPSSTVAHIGWLRDLCAYAEKHHIRIFNDASYAALTYVPTACTLAEVAVNFPNLSWAEAYSAANLIGNDAWSIGAIVGSPDFIGDIKIIRNKLGADQVLAPLAAGVLAVLGDVRTKREIGNNFAKYRKNTVLLWDILHDGGMHLCLDPESGLCALCRVPKYAFRKQVADAREFNDLMAKKAGIIGIPFGKDYIAYSAATINVAAMKNDIVEAFIKADVCYEY